MKLETYVPGITENPFRVEFVNQTAIFYDEVDDRHLIGFAAYVHRSGKPLDHQYTVDAKDGWLKFCEKVAEEHRDFVLDFVETMYGIDETSRQYENITMGLELPDNVGFQEYLNSDLEGDESSTDYQLINSIFIVVDIQ
jgi:hypothetical protein